MAAAVAPQPPRTWRAAPRADAAPRRALASLGDFLYLLYPLLPRSWIFATARLRGTLQDLLRTRARRIVRANYATLFPDRTAAELDALTRRFLQNQQSQNLLVMLASRLRTEELARLAPFERLDRLEWALAQKKGVIVLVSHINSASFFAGNVWLRRSGFDVRVAMPIVRDPWDRTWLRILADGIAGIAPIKDQLGCFYCQFNLRPIVERLKEGAAVALTGDGWHSAGFVEVEFLGRKVPFTTGALSIARSSGAVVVPVFATGAPPDRLRFVLEEPFTVSREGPSKRAVQAAATAYALRVEHHLLRNPASWQHLLEEDVFETMATWQQRTLTERYDL